MNNSAVQYFTVLACNWMLICNCYCEFCVILLPDNACVVTVINVFGESLMYLLAELCCLAVMP